MSTAIERVLAQPDREAIRSLIRRNVIGLRSHDRDAPVYWCETATGRKIAEAECVSEKGFSFNGFGCFGPHYLTRLEFREIKREHERETGRKWITDVPQEWL